MKDPKKRFSDRVNNYKLYRPNYPVEAIRFIKDQCNADDKWAIADLGSGTGISTGELLSTFECPIFAVEPNENMRTEAELKFGDNPRFRSINGSSENTNLDSVSVNLIAAFQAFHWFDRDKSIEEFQRILKPPKWVVLAWNDRNTKGTPFLEGYDKILKNLPDYLSSSHKSTDENIIKNFLGNEKLVRAEFQNSQSLDLEGLKGRFFSSSYTPNPGTENYKKQIANLEKLFSDTHKNGKVEITYTTQVYMGVLKKRES